ncbi:MAG: hypothetical protein PHV54_05915 [Tolumonas sp.]|nr:hypothetical protein [Tolumonas sp.]
MNTQQQEIDVVQHKTKWQAPELVELGNISGETQLNNNTHGNDTILSGS